MSTPAAIKNIAPVPHDATITKTLSSTICQTTYIVRSYF